MDGIRFSDESRAAGEANHILFVRRLVTQHATLQHQRMDMKYKIAIHQSDEGYSVSVPGLPGCWSQGATEQEALKNIKDAVGTMWP